VSFSRRVGADLWVGFADAEPGWPLVAGNSLAVDRQASARAARLALAASGLAAGGYAISRSHTQGIGAAAVAPAGVRVGVDLVLTTRVSDRHAAVVLSAAEWEALAPEGAMGPALGWALKEAAGKATGEPARYFPNGLCIERAPGAVLVRAGGQWFDAGWLRLGAMLCVWVRESPRRLPFDSPPGAAGNGMVAGTCPGLIP
jgi:hypothetical protein